MNKGKQSPHIRGIGTTFKGDMGWGNLGCHLEAIIYFDWQGHEHSEEHKEGPLCPIISLGRVCADENLRE